MRRIRIILVLLAVAGLLVGLVPVTLEAQPTAPVVVRFYFDDPSQLNAVAGELDIWEVQVKAGYAVAAVTPDQYQWLESLGYPLEIDAEKTTWLGIDAPLDPRFYYFDDYYPNPNGRYIVDFLQDVNTNWPDYVELFDIGNAWLADNGGYHRDIWVLRISNEDPAFGDIADKPPFYFFAGIHARETVGPEMAIRYIKYLTDGYLGEGGYGVDPDVTWLVDWNVVYVLVMQNPDGHVENEQNTANSRRKNMDNDDCGDPATWGIDLNRNHSFFWGCCGGSSGNPCDITYRGPSRGSEPETQAFQYHFAAVMLDQNGPNGDDELPPAAPDDATGIFITIHSYTDLMLWPYAFSGGSAPNDAQLRTIGRKFSYYNGYDPIGFWYTADGSTDDWTYGKFGIASFTYEIGPSGGVCGAFFPSYDCFDGAGGAPRNFWGENKPTFIYAHKIARTPYMTAYGPDTENVVVVPDPVPQGTPVQLTAIVADHRYGGDPLRPIHGAEYFFDQPGDDGAGTAMAPADGSWGDLSENVEATVDTGALTPGQHYLLVHGLNDDGDWGPFTAVFLTVAPYQCVPVQEVDIAGPDTLLLGQEGTYTAAYAPITATQPVTFTWDNGTVGDTAVYSWTTAGVYTIAATATNECGAAGDTLTVTVPAPCEPVQNVLFDWTPLAPVAGEVVTFTGIASGTLPIRYSWQLDVGSWKEGQVVTNTYALPGDYAIVLTATNCVSATAQASAVLTVLPEPMEYYYVYLPLVSRGTARW
jgi:carboxypeptidase T